VIYDIEWLDDALYELDEIWGAADEILRAKIARALGRIHDRLIVAPYSQGESRTPGKPRIFFELPLRVLYRIERFRGAVTVLEISLVLKRR
jgi:hypothetical protein